MTNRDELQEAKDIIESFAPRRPSGQTRPGMSDEDKQGNNLAYDRFVQSNGNSNSPAEGTPTLVSDCHHAAMRVISDSFGEGTNHYHCTVCGEPCNWVKELEL